MKLKLNKEKIAKLTNEQASSVNGGGTNHSTQHNFTCCWCSSGSDSYHCPQSVEVDGTLCPPYE